MFRYLAIAFVLIAAGCAQAAEKRLDRTFTVAPGGTLTVDADGASVHVSGSDGNQVVVHMLVRSSESDLANTQLEAVQNDTGVSVTLRRSKRSWLFAWGNWNNEESIEVTVPRRYAVNVRTSGGGLELRDTVGAANLRTSGGSVSVKNVTGNVEARTSGGSIQAETIKGDVDADTSGGDVRLLHVDGKIRGNTSGGSVRCSLVGANRGISAKTSGGSIELTVPKGTTGNVDASTSGGNVKSELPVTSTEWEDTRIVGSINGGGEPIYARTSGGSVSLRAEN
jgi:DUF4097 and DUF4098 domain-containing protein YvlB